MKTKFITTIVTSMILVLFASVGSAFAGWRDWSQSTRNQAIVNRTYQDVNDYVGESCKVWVQTVVYSASGGAVYPPQNEAYPCSWRTDQPGSPYSIDTGKSIEDAVPGEIVQMVLSNGKEHTAVVLEISPSWITFVESNWFKDKYVRIRSELLNGFDDHVSCYTIYRIE